MHWANRGHHCGPVIFVEPQPELAAAKPPLLDVRFGSPPASQGKQVAEEKPCKREKLADNCALKGAKVTSTFSKGDELFEPLCKRRTKLIFDIAVVLCQND